MAREPVTADLGEEDLARVDALARVHGVTRDEMIARLLRTGMVHEERLAREARARRQGGGS